MMTRARLVASGHKDEKEKGDRNRSAPRHWGDTDIQVASEIWLRPSSSTLVPTTRTTGAQGLWEARLTLHSSSSSRTHR